MSNRLFIAILASAFILAGVAGRIAAAVTI